MNNLKHFRAGRMILAIFMVAAAVLWLGGCESDSVAPHDELPTLSRSDAAQQAGIVAAGLHRLGPQILRFTSAKSKDVGVYTYDFATEDYVDGEVTLEFFTGGSGGTHVSYDVADYGMLYTAPGEILGISLEFPGSIVVAVGLTLDLTGDIDQGAGTADVSGGGTMISDLWTGDFHFTEVHVTRVEGYPSSGTLEFTGGSWEMLVTYDGDRMAVISHEGVDLYEVDLDTGLVSLIV